MGHYRCDMFPDEYEEAKRGIKKVASQQAPQVQLRGVVVPASTGVPSEPERTTPTSRVRDSHAPCPHCKAVPAALCFSWCPLVVGRPASPPAADPTRARAFLRPRLRWHSGMMRWTCSDQLAKQGLGRPESAPTLVGAAEAWLAWFSMSHG